MLVVTTSLQGDSDMAKNVGGRRIGAIRGRTQFKLPSGHYAKVDRKTGEILSIKADRKPYKNVIIEKATPIERSAPGVAEMAERVSLPLVRQPVRRTPARQLPLERAVAAAGPAIWRGANGPRRA